MGGNEEVLPLFPLSLVRPSASSPIYHNHRRIYLSVALPAAAVAVTTSSLDRGADITSFDKQYRYTNYLASFALLQSFFLCCTRNCIY